MKNEYNELDLLNNNEYENDSVFVNNSGDITDRKYNLYIGLTLLWGFVINLLMVNYFDLASYGESFSIWFLLGYFVSCFLGAIISRVSKKPIWSFVGYNLIVLPMGLVLDMFLSYYSPYMITSAVAITGVVTLVMMILGAAFPKLFCGFGRMLGITLLITIICEVITTFFVPSFPGQIYDYICIVLFCGYIGYDWTKANMKVKTLDNAIDSACDIYLDIINLFIRILSSRERRK